MHYNEVHVHLDEVRDARKVRGLIVEKAAQTTIRMTEVEREAWEQAAAADGRSLSAWITRRCNGEPTTAPMLPGSVQARKPTRKGKVQ